MSQVINLARARLEKRRNYPAPHDDPAELPATDAAEEVAPAPTVVASLIGALVLIDYSDAEGNVSRGRKITIRDIVAWGSDLAVVAWCHQRRGPRKFLARRILQIIDLATGEVHEDPARFLREEVGLLAPTLSPAAATQAARERCAADLSILVFLGHCDGFFDPAEQAVVADHVAARCSDLPYDPEAMRRYIARLYPDSDNFFAAIERLQHQPVAAIAQLARSIARLIEADGELAGDEVSFVLELRQLAHELGVEMPRR